MSPDRAAPGKKNRHTGFTLIELLVVILILGILMAVTLTVIGKVKRAAYGAATQAQLSALANAIQQYYNDYKSYPGPLSNNQINTASDSSPLPSAYGYNLAAQSAFSGAAYDPSQQGTFAPVITGAQNLVLGLLGGLEITSNNGSPSGFIYNAQDIFSDGTTPAPKGPASLNFSSPGRTQAYIQVRPGDLSTPNKNYGNGGGASFADSASRSPVDAMIPVFLDKYSDPMPILYYRTNVGGTAIAGFRSGNTYTDGMGGTLQTTGGAFGGGGQNEIAQYDLVQNLPYVKSGIGLIASNPNSLHGLQGLGNANLTDPIDTNNNGTFTPSNSGSNALAYFKDPSLNSATVSPSNTNLGVARQKDGFLLISAGPDRQYGTHDDNIHPGPLVP